MPGQSPLSKPEFIVSHLDEAAIPARLLEESIFAHPEAYQDSSSDQATGLDEEAQERFANFFQQGYYKQVGFDEMTEESLDTNPEHARVVSEFRSAKEDKREQARELVGRSRIAIFAGRVALWQAARPNQTTEDDLRHSA